MKILHVCESVIGGTGSYLSEVVPHQVEKYGADNILFLIPENHLDFLDPAVIQTGVRFHLFPRPSRLLGVLGLLRAYGDVLRSFQPDIVHAHSSVAGLLVRVVGRRRRRFGIVFCPHGWAVDRKGARLMRLLVEMTERSLAARADRIIVISRHEYSRGRDLGIADDRLRLVISGISAHVPQFEPTEWHDQRLRVLFVGRYDYQKGVDILLNAVSLDGDRMSIRLVGGGVVDKLALPQPFPAHVADLGWRDRSEVYAQMKSCDVLVVPSRWEGFGLVVLEAMRLSVPVVAAAVGGLKETLDDGLYGIVFPPEDPRALRQALLSLTKEDLERMSRLSHDRFVSTYRADRMLAQIDAVYVEVAAKR